ncbi:hypothetical protein C8A05DRAFT_17683 [Staphylotrichum tortipilum]|uniref:Rhodopsin domain-containing protein n=1 Tax=Staphylotrichum tortipilum TaxID=2831512 RepID=A0AAN6RR64_9PEZI|nr:hypothetical protein C8A05DRAFT_17683 [Staphylotrichum longicolle]
MPTTADVSHGRRIVATLWPMVAVSGLVVALKILARGWRRMRWWWDDYLMLMSWLCLTVASAFLTTATTYGLGRHIQFLDQAERHAVLRLGYFAAIFSIGAAVWSKVSFALFLLRISSSGVTECIRRGILGIIISLNIMLVAAITMILMSCRPTAKTWKPELEGTCLDDKVKVAWTVALAAYSGVADLILALLPWKIIWYLPVKRRDKFGLAVMMSLGTFAAAASFMKCAYIHEMVSEDFIDGFMLIFWSIFEPTLTIILSSIPVIRTFIRDLVRAYSTRRSSRRLETESMSSSDTRSAYTANNELVGRKLPAGADRGGPSTASESMADERGDDLSKIEGQENDNV